MKNRQNEVANKNELSKKKKAHNEIWNQQVILNNAVTITHYRLKSLWNLL